MPLAALAVCMKIGAVNADRKRPIVSFSAEWEGRGRPVTVEEIRPRDVPVYAKFTVTRASGEKAEGFVTADIAEKLAARQEIRFENGTIPCGRVVSVARELDPIAGMYPVTVEFNDPAPAAGSPLVVYARTQTIPSAVLVPNEVLDASSGCYSVWRVRNGKAEKTVVTVASRDGYGTVLSGGLHPGDAVVLTGRSGLAADVAVACQGAQAELGAGAR